MPVKRYDQFCGVARALEVVGERWTMLIVRELMTGPKRFSDLRSGLGPIAPTVLTERLRTLTDAGVVTRRDLPPPAASTAYELTPRGEELRPVLLALGRWGTPLLAQGRQGESFSARWLLIALWDRFRPPRDGRDVVIEFRIGQEVVHAEVRDGQLDVGDGPASAPDHVIESPPQLFARWGLGQVTTDTAVSRGLHLSQGTATAELIEEIFPAAGS